MNQPDATAELAPAAAKSQPEGWMLCAIQSGSAAGDSQPVGADIGPPALAGVTDGRERFCPATPTTLAQTGLRPQQLASLILKMRLNTGVAAQSVSHEQMTLHQLEAALADLELDRETISRIAQALAAGRALLLYGEPGNGKTSIAERLTRAFSPAIWIPRAISIGEDIVRLYDPVVHEEIVSSGLTQTEGIDQRWVRIRRPTMVAGGELTLDNLQITVNRQIGVLEAPIQLKSLCGTLVIDDFGRQRMRPEELLNRWIVPLERGYDFVHLPSGKKVQIPFDQLVVFSTNLRPSEIVDGAFLRRIAYKIKFTDPDEGQFRRLLKQQARKSTSPWRTISLRSNVTHHDGTARSCHSERTSARPLCAPRWNCLANGTPPGATALPLETGSRH